MTKAIVLIATGFEEIEGLTVVNVLRRGGVDVTLMGIHDNLLVRGSRGISVKADCSFNEEALHQADAVILPGGVEGTEHLARFEPLLEHLKAVNAHQLIGAICAAPSVLADVGLLDGRRATSNPSYEAQVTKHPVIYVKQAVVRDENIVTSRGMGTSLVFALELLEILEGKNAREEVEKGVVFDELVGYIKNNYA